MRAPPRFPRIFDLRGGGIPPDLFYFEVYIAFNAIITSMTITVSTDNSSQ